MFVYCIQDTLDFVSVVRDKHKLFYPKGFKMKKKTRTTIKHHMAEVENAPNRTQDVHLFHLQKELKFKYPASVRR